MNEGYLRDKLPFFDNLEPRMKELEKANVWKIVERETVANYCRMHDDVWNGVRFVLQLNKNKNDALQRLQASPNNN